MRLMRTLFAAVALLAFASVPALAQYDSAYVGGGVFNTTITAPTLTTTTTVTAGTTVTGTTGGIFGVVGTHDRILITPIVKGAGQFDGTLSSVDLTGARAWNLPNLSGTIALMGVDNGSTFQATTVTAGTLTGHLLDTTFVTPVNAKAATGILTYTATNPTASTPASYAFVYTDANLPIAGDTATIGFNGQYCIYTFTSSPATGGDVKIGTADATAANLTCAINDTGCTEGAGQDFMAAAPCAYVSATTDPTGSGTGTITLTGRMVGAYGNTACWMSAVWDGGEGNPFFADHVLENGVTADSVTVNGLPFWFVAEVGMNGEVKVGADSDATAANLLCALRNTGCSGGGTIGGDYWYNTPPTGLTYALDNAGSGGHIDVTANTKGVAGNTSNTLADSGDQYTETDFATAATGVDGTIGAKGDLRFDTAYAYFCTAANAIGDANWGRAALTVGY